MPASHDVSGKDVADDGIAIRLDSQLPRVRSNHPSRRLASSTLAGLDRHAGSSPLSAAQRLRGGGLAVGDPS